MNNQDKTTEENPNPTKFQLLKMRVNYIIHLFTNKNHFVHNCWKLWIALISLYMILMMPFRACFFVTEHWLWIPFDYIFDLFLVIDIIISALTPYEVKGSTQLERRYHKTILHYIKYSAIIDIPPIIPFNLIYWIPQVQAAGITQATLRLNRVLKALRINYFFQKFEAFFGNKFNPAIIRVGNFLLYVVLLAHWITCCWYLIARLEGDQSMFWTMSNILMEADTGLDFKYLLGLYWALVTMTGYGGTMPITNVECLFSIAVVFLGVAVYVTIIGTVGSLVTNLDTNAAKFREKMDTINDYMKYRNLDDHLRNQVRSYYTYIWNSRKGLDETKVLEDLPDFLRMSVAVHLNRDIIKKVSLFQNADDTFVSQIVMRLKPRVSLPNSYIIRLGESGGEMFFISKGTVEVVNAQGKVVHSFKDGEFFGEVALVFNVKRTASIRAVDFCDLFVLLKEDFHEILEAYPEQAAIIRAEADKRKNANAKKKPPTPQPSKQD